jgi:hypothetical protein
VRLLRCMRMQPRYSADRYARLCTKAVLALAPEATLSAWQFDRDSRWRSPGRTDHCVTYALAVVTIQGRHYPVRAMMVLGSQSTRRVAVSVPCAVDDRGVFYGWYRIRGRWPVMLLMS